MIRPRPWALKSPRAAATALIVAFATSGLPSASAQTTRREPIRGFTNAPALTLAYDAILDADFNRVGAQLDDACGGTPVWCTVLDAVSLWWQIALDPEDRQRDETFSRTVHDAIDSSEAWTRREPQRAEAWFARGAAYAARAQWRTERGARLAAARDGKEIKNALERALAIDPDMHDAKFGLGMYRYYAAVAPAALRMFRWLLQLPGGDRRGGLAQMLDARDRGDIVGGEADYQLHLIYLWYENRPHDALALLRRLQQRYPHNPLFVLREADVQREYFHDASTSAGVLRALIVRAEAGDIHLSALAARRARASLAELAVDLHD